MQNTDRLRHLAELFSHPRLRFWIMLVGVFLSLLGFEEIADDVFRDPLEGDTESEVLDRSISTMVAEFRDPRLTQVMTDMTALGSISVVVTLFLILASILTTFRDFRGLAYISIVLTGAGLWPHVLKSIFGRARPPEMDRLVEVASLSFPSGHSFGAASAYIGLAYYAARAMRNWRQEMFFYGLSGLLILIVGISRIYLGVHYATDVIAGLCGGTAWGLLSACVYEYFAPTRRNQKGLKPS